MNDIIILIVLGSILEVLVGYLTVRGIIKLVKMQKNERRGIYDDKEDEWTYFQMCDLQ